MSTRVNGRELSAGWNAELSIKMDSEWSPVTLADDVHRFVYSWLGLTGDPSKIDWSELVQDENNGEERWPSWLIPLDVDHLAELVCNDRYLNEIHKVDGIEFKILIDMTDF